MRRLKHGRIEGRKGVALRIARLKAEPLCRDCLAEGYVTASVVPDHIVPLALGGVEDGLVRSPNVRCLCLRCGDKRTREQFGQRERVEIDPTSGCPVNW